MLIELKMPRVGGTNYGGNQAWFENSLHAAGSCGVVAAANLNFYLRKKDPSLEEFMLVSRSLYHALAPLHFYNPFAEENTWGLPFFKRYMQRLRAWFRATGLDLQSQTYRGAKRGMRNFFWEQIQAERAPILLVLGAPKSLKAYDRHYLLITGIDLKRGMLIASSWGQRVQLPLEELLKSYLLRTGVLR